MIAPGFDIVIPGRLDPDIDVFGEAVDDLKSLR
jgi:hypothetical protein